MRFSIVRDRTLHSVPKVDFLSKKINLIKNLINDTILIFVSKLSILTAKNIVNRIFPDKLYFVILSQNLDFWHVKWNYDILSKIVKIEFFGQKIGL